MGVLAHFYHIMVPASLKLYAGKFFGNYMLGNFLETICWEIFWKLYAGKFGWIQAVFEGEIMVLCYGGILRFKAMAPGAGDSGNTALSRPRRAKA